MKAIARNILLALVVLAGAAYAYTIYLVHQHRGAVKSQLKDPDSAKFQNENLKGGYTLASSILCGEVNAKNGMGGYDGYKRFAASGSTKQVEIANDDTGLIFVKAYCDK